VGGIDLSNEQCRIGLVHSMEENVLHRYFKQFLNVSLVLVGRDSSIGISTRYGLDGQGIESRWGRDFPHPSRPALEPTQPPIQWVPGFSRG
jgi:hypothetical protein